MPRKDAVRTVRAREFFRDPWLSIEVLRAPSHGDYPRHRHDFTELVLILGGSGGHIVDGEERPVAAGDAFVLQGAQSHAFRRAGKLSLVNVIFKPEHLSLPWKELRKIPGYQALFVLEPKRRREGGAETWLRMSPLELARVTETVSLMEAELRERRTGYEAMAIDLLLSLIVRLSRAYSGGEGDTRALLCFGETLSEIEANFAERLTLPGLARTARMPVSTFLRVFKEATGLSPMAYVSAVRVARASELLRDRRMKITDIAMRCGFGDSNYFSRRFRAAMGVSPREYRERA